MVLRLSEVIRFARPPILIKGSDPTDAFELAAEEGGQAASIDIAVEIGIKTQGNQINQKWRSQTSCTMLHFALDAAA